LFYPLFGFIGLGIGVACGAFFHFAIQIPFIVGQGLFPRFRLPFNFGLIKKVIVTSIPRTLTVSSSELSKLFLISLAALLVPGSVSIFNFAFNLQSVPFSIIGISYALAAFPVLIQLYNAGETDKFVRQMVVSSQHIIFWSIPITVLFVVLRAQIVRILLGAGRFDWNDTRLTAAALAIFTLSLVAQNLMNLFVRAYYSRGQTKIPLIMNMISAGVIIGSSYALVYLFNHYLIFGYFIESLFKVSGISGTVVLMLPLGFTIGMLLNALIHWIGFHREFRTYSKPVLKTLFQTTAGSLIMGYVAYVSLTFFSTLFNLETLIGIFLQGFLSGMVGIIALIVVLVLLKSYELQEVWSTLHQKIWRAKVVPPDAEL
jgi:putative peptidoglycan lipid II flippase